jgi:hypothetical protein
MKLQVAYVYTLRCIQQASRHIDTLPVDTGISRPKAANKSVLQQMHLLIRVVEARHTITAYLGKNSKENCHEV